VCAIDSSHRETRTGAAALGHDWNEWGTPAAATVTEDGFKARICKRDNTHTETAFSGEYATGTAGLAFELINNNTEYRVRKGTVTTGTVHIPAYHRPNANSTYLPVTEIGASSDWNNDGAFAFTSITAVTFASNSPLRYIGQWAFYRTNLASVTIPASVTSIPYGAFNECRSLASVTIPAGVTSIGDSAFGNCESLTSITISLNVTSIGMGAFSGCESLTSVTIPAGVTSIGDIAFSFCTGLTGITVANGNPNYSSEGGILYNKAKTTLIQAPGAISGAVTIPSSVTSIGMSAFSFCESLTNVTIPASVTSIGWGAFSGCESLTGITIPSGVTSIGYQAFMYCTSLTSITIPAGVTSIGYSVFRDWISSQTINVPFANDSAKPAGWSSDWKYGCNAVIKYWNGSSYQ
jgi:hypothetical protein